MDFESELSTIQALTGASTTEMSKMQVLALKMGADTKYSALEAAQGIEELLKAGLEPAQVQAGGLEASLNLATAGGLDLAEAAATMSTSINAFRKDGMAAATVSNILAGTANVAATDVHELSYAIASGGAVADMAGLSFRDFNTAIGLMSNDGLKSGSDAGTSFKSMLMYLQPQTKQATKLFNQLGIGVGKANKFFSKGKIKDIAGIAEVLKKAFGGMSEQMRTDKMMEMFGTDGVKAASTLFKAGSDGVKQFQKDLSNVTALDVAKKKMDNASGAVEQFRGAVETLQISALTPLLPAVKRAANAAADFVTAYTPQITQAIQKMVDQASSYINEHYNNDYFKGLSLEAQVGYVFSDLQSTFNSWWSSSGKSQFESATTTVVQTMLGIFQASVPQMTDIGLQLGQGLAKGIWDGIKDNAFNFEWDKPNWWKEFARGDNGTAWKHLIFGGGEDGPAYKPQSSVTLDPMKNQLPSAFQNNNAPALSPAKAPVQNTNTFVYSPKQTFNGPVDKAAIQEATKSGGERFAEQFAKFKQQQNRVSFGQ